VSPTKQARGDSVKDPKLHQVIEWREKKIGSARRSVLLWPTNEHCVIGNQDASQVRIWIGSVQSSSFCLEINWGLIAETVSLDRVLL